MGRAERVDDARRLDIECVVKLTSLGRLLPCQDSLIGWTLTTRSPPPNGHHRRAPRICRHPSALPPLSPYFYP